MTSALRALCRDSHTAITLTTQRFGHDKWSAGRSPDALRSIRRGASLSGLTFGGNIIETGTTSYRLAHTLAQRSS